AFHVTGVQTCALPIYGGQVAAYDVCEELGPGRHALPAASGQLGVGVAARLELVVDADEAVGQVLPVVGHGPAPLRRERLVGVGRSEERRGGKGRRARA